MRVKLSLGNGTQVRKIKKKKVFGKTKLRINGKGLFNICIKRHLTPTKIKFIHFKSLFYQQEIYLSPLRSCDWSKGLFSVENENNANEFNSGSILFVFTTKSVEKITPSKIKKSNTKYLNINVEWPLFPYF